MIESIRISYISFDSVLIFLLPLPLPQSNHNGSPTKVVSNYDEEAAEPTPEPGPDAGFGSPEEETAGDPSPSTLERLAPAIAECFAVILCG